jgi:hypothetical protein
MDELPAPNTTMLSPEAREFLQEIRDDMRALKSAVRGDDMGNPGLVKSISSLDERITGHVAETRAELTNQRNAINEIDRKLAKWVGALAGLGLAVEVAHALFSK